MHNLTYPPVLTYFIAYNDSGCVSYGVNDTGQCTTTGQPNFDTYTDFDAFVAALAGMGVVYNN